MLIDKDIEIVDLALYLRKKKILLIADTHIGYEEALNKQGILIPRFQFSSIVRRLEDILKKLPKLDRIVINGDIKHEFGKISEQEWRQTLKLLDLLQRYCDEIILIRGNHDKIIGPIAEKRNVEVMDDLIIDDILITHGSSIPEAIIRRTPCKSIIIGHEHPAVSLVDESRAETYKCFLKGKWRDKTLIVQPSFNQVTEGTDILKEQLLSPFLLQDMSDFRVYVVADKIYDFGILKDIK